MLLVYAVLIQAKVAEIIEIAEIGPDRTHEAGSVDGCRRIKHIKSCACGTESNVGTVVGTDILTGEEIEPCSISTFVRRTALRCDPQCLEQYLAWRIARMERIQMEPDRRQGRIVHHASLFGHTDG